ncbi:MAG: TetR/AcrR family transcriptional regulator, partial [Gaiellales bacterium]
MPGDVKRRYRADRRREQAAQTRQRVLDAAATLFDQRGFDGASVAAIAEEAGVSEETVYARFRNKRTLLGEVIRRAVRGDDPKPVPEQSEPRA